MMLQFEYIYMARVFSSHIIVDIFPTILSSLVFIRKFLNGIHSVTRAHEHTVSYAKRTASFGAKTYCAHVLLSHHG